METGGSQGRQVQFYLVCIWFGLVLSLHRLAFLHPPPIYTSTVQSATMRLEKGEEYIREERERIK
jgi:hypothetical protein